MSDFAHRTISVVRCDIHQQSYTAWSVAFKEDFFVGRARKFARAALNCALDIVGGHVLGLGGSYGRAQAWIALSVSPARLGGHGDFLD